MKFLNVTTQQILMTVTALMCLHCSTINAQQQRSYFDKERWDGDVESFEAMNKKQMPEAGGILFTGSSSIRFWHERLERDMAPLQVIGRGYGGSTMQDSVYLIDRLVLPYKPRAIVLYQGDNDIGAFNVPATQVRDLFQLFVAQVHKQLPDTRIYMLAIKPSILRRSHWYEMDRANTLLKIYCDSDPKLTFIDVASPLLTDGKPNGELLRDDKLHLNEKGYDLWTSIVKPVLLDNELQHQ